MPWVPAGAGVQRQVLAHSPELMLVKVAFETGAVGAEHQHPHTQISYVESGEFAYTIGGETRVLRAGDSCVVPGNTLHGTACRQAGVLLDAFTPMRADFV
ncbi:cupin domain-containing protein [Hymenobacter busanensis]|uniref:Cupin domain-containing protein n=2 Tax=Hymenobacter busanensis TaxID=2607656 RepID=A0A7L4ZW37_9BACT|nr:cupin domain-containing protein [Hymenobacter busanensis]KAA9339183.1 cupin domain-containing protein [Hymenobacter busanensis]QHJ07055.1 cupin domain-containing protein [Hymenobacter busanensis]